MTDSEKVNLKEKIKKVMIDHLTTVGYPKIKKEVIMSELKNMWIKIEEAGLVKEGLTLQGFTSQANEAFMMQQIKDIMNF